MDVLNWREIRFSPVKLDPRMLLEGGYTVRRKCFLKTDNHKQVIPEYRYVTYDKDFVVYYVSSQLRPLKNISQDNFKKLMDEVLFNLNQDAELL